MKQIELTEEHKKHLIKMCNHLFPVYGGWWMTFQNGNTDAKSENLLFVHNTDEKGNQTTIHWFEFCMTYLVIKLNISKEDYLTLSLKCTDKVNYLYEKFKKLK